MEKPGKRESLEGFPDPWEHGSFVEDLCNLGEQVKEQSGSPGSDTQ